MTTNIPSKDDPGRAMARAACEAGYISIAEYMNIIEQGDGLVADINSLTESEFSRRNASPRSGEERPALASAPPTCPPPVSVGHPFYVASTVE